MVIAINPAKVDFVTLRLFCAVAQSGSITKGAEQCHLALSAASRRLSDFESATGSQLLERSRQGIKLTSAGHSALQHALRLFQGFERFSSELSEYSSGARGRVRLWANMSALTEFLPGLLSEFLTRYPDIRVDVEEQLSGDIVRALIDGVADVGVFAEGTPTFGLNVMAFRTDVLVVACSHKHALAKRRTVAFADCLDHDFVGLNRGSSLLELTSRAAEQAGRELRVRIQVRSFDAMCQMISSDLGIGVLPLAACTSHSGKGGIKTVRITDSWATRKLLMASKSDAVLSASTLRLLEVLASMGAPKS